jgi:hypothetical protein
MKLLLPFLLMPHAVVRDTVIVFFMLSCFGLVAFDGGGGDGHLPRGGGKHR